MKRSREYPERTRRSEIRWPLLLAGLVFSPVIPLALSTPAVWLLGQSGLSKAYGAITMWVGYLLAAEVWTMVTGIIGTLVIHHQRGYFSRASCVWTAIAGAVTFPFMFGLVGAAQSRGLGNESWFWFFIAGIIILMIGAIPLGAIGGWILWYVADSPMRSDDVTTVFD